MQLPKLFFQTSSTSFLGIFIVSPSRSSRIPGQKPKVNHDCLLQINSLTSLVMINVPPYSTLYKIYTVKGASFKRVICTTHFALINVYYIDLLKPTGYVMHQQFNIQHLYALPTLYLRVLYLSENTQ